MARTRGLIKRCVQLTGCFLAVSAWMVSGLAGCSTGSGSVDLVRMADRETPAGVRASMIRRTPDAATLGEVNAAEAYETLKVIAWQRASSAEQVRLPAIDALLTFNEREAETRAMLRLLLPTEPLGARPVVERIAQVAGERGWKELAPALIRRWTKPLGGYESAADRPERAALATLFPEQQPEDLVFAFFTGALLDPDARLLTNPEQARLVAWDLLTELEPDRDRLLARLRSSVVNSDDDVLSVLSAAAKELNVVPVTSSELRWLLNFADQPAAWASARSVVASLDGARQTGLTLRHMPAIVWASNHQPAWTRQSTDELLAAADQAIAGRQRFVRSPEFVGRAHSEQIRDWRDMLCWGDALLLRATVQAVLDPRVEAAAFVIADLDMNDKSTEHGGTIAPNNQNSFDLIHYAPRATERVGDHSFVAPAAMHDESTLAIIHFHLHAQRHKNEAYAGPSAADMEYARLHQRSCIVFTFLDADTLNADYYQPNGVVIDLGSLKR